MCPLQLLAQHLTHLCALLLLLLCRVQLSNEGPYINASYVQLQVPHLPQACSYIATQGPLPHTTSHFWQMVMDNEVRRSSPAAALDTAQQQLWIQHVQDACLQCS